MTARGHCEIFALPKGNNVCMGRVYTRWRWVALRSLPGRLPGFSPLGTALPVNHLPMGCFAHNCCFRYWHVKGRENHIKCSAKNGAEVIDMTVRNARARSEAGVRKADKCLGCKLRNGARRFCEILGIEIWTQCCICRGGHQCYYWDLCEACQDIKEGDSDGEESN